MKWKLKATAMLLVCSVPNVMAIEWTSIIKNKDYEIFVDIDSYNVEGSYPYLISKTIFNRPQIYSLNNKDMQYFVTIQNAQFNCDEPLFKVKSIDLYGLNSELLASKKGTAAFKKINANTHEFAIGQLTCQVHQMLAGQ